MDNPKVSPIWLENLDKPHNSLRNIQKTAKEKLKNLHFPNSKDEAWRFSNIKSLNNFIHLPIRPQLESKLNKEYPDLKNYKDEILQISLNNHIHSISLPNGIRVIHDKELESLLGETLKKCKCNENWQVNINESSANQVIGLEFEGKSIPHVEFIFEANSNSFNSTRLFLKVNQNTNLDFTQIIIGSNKSAQSNLTEIIIKENSKVNHNFIALGGGNANLLANIAIQQNLKSEYSLVNVQSGWLFSRFEPNVIQSNGKAQTNIHSLQVSVDKQQLSTHSKVRFEGPEGKLDQLNKAVAKDNSHCLFNGAIEVPRIAQKTEAAQLSRNLILSKRARIDAKPELEIIADDVRCTHGATVSQLQEEELFYLKSRGIESHQASSLLLEGYYQEILQKLTLYSSRWKFLNNILCAQDI